MSKTRQGKSSAEIDQIMAQRVTDAIEVIAIYETKIRMTHDPMNQVIRQETPVEKNANNKRKFENQPKDNRVPQQPPFKKPDVARAYTIGANEKKAYTGNLPYYNKCKLHHVRTCTVKCSNCKKVGHMTRYCKASIAREPMWQIQRLPSLAINVEDCEILGMNARSGETLTMTDADEMKSQTGYVFVLNGGVVDWKSYMDSTGLGVVPTIEEPINMYCDNTRAIAIAKYHGVTKGAVHFHAKVHYLRETIEMGDVRIEKVDTYDNLADPFTKALAFPKHYELTEKIGMILASSLI
ncbi:hypothetical protein Tco_0461398 [Tanacetum coccineum]